MKRTSLGAVCVSAILFSLAAAPLHSAMAADLGVKAPPAPPPDYNWTGFYAGVQGGYGWGTPEWDNSSATSWAYSWRADGGFGGGMIGANYEFTKAHIVVGIQGEYNGASLSGSNTDTGAAPNPDFGNRHSATLNSFGSVDARLGIALTGFAWDRTLLYLIGGAAFGDPRQTFTTPGGASVTFNGGEKNGWDFGAGLDYALTANWILRGEWRMYWFTPSSFGPTAGVVNSGVTVPFAARETVNTARAGIAYKF
jgi:outer membrane immunogenic protein